MHDPIDYRREFKRVMQRIDELEQRIKQLSDRREARVATLRHDPLLCITNADFSAGDTIEVERLIFDGSDVPQRSGETFDALDVFLNDADDPVESGTKVIVEWIDGKSCMTNIYCAPADNVS